MSDAHHDANPELKKLLELPITGQPVALAKKKKKKKTLPEGKGAPPPQMSEEERERVMSERLRAQLQSILAQDPAILDAQIDTKLAERISTMTNAELRARINLFKSQKNNKISEGISSSIIAAIDSIVGGILGVKDILQEKNKKDAMLQKTANSIISDGLFIIPDQYKFPLLYGINAFSSVVDKKMIDRKEMSKEK